MSKKTLLLLSLMAYGNCWAADTQDGTEELVATQKDAARCPICPICLEEVQDGMTFKKNINEMGQSVECQCKARYHKRCAQDERIENCPTCRSSIVPMRLIELFRDKDAIISLVHLPCATINYFTKERGPSMHTFAKVATGIDFILTCNIIKNKIITANSLRLASEYTRMTKTCLSIAWEAYFYLLRSKIVSL